MHLARMSIDVTNSLVHVSVKHDSKASNCPVCLGGHCSARPKTPRPIILNWVRVTS